MPGTTSSDPRAGDVDVARLLASGAAAAALCRPPVEDEATDGDPEEDEASESDE
jgi:hypothetical protein